MGYSRTLTATPGGAVQMDVRTDTAQFELIAEARRDILVELSTEDDENSEAGEAIRQAWGELSGRTYQLDVPGPETAIVQSGNFGSVIIGDMVVMHGGTFVNGREVRPGGRGSFSRGVTATVRFPEDSPLHIETKSGSASVRGRIGKLSGRTSSGSIQAVQAHSLELSASSGSIYVNDVIDTASVDVSSGNVSLRRVDGRVALSASSGNVSVDDLGGSGWIRVSSGNIVVGRFTGSNLSLEAGSGNVNHPEHAGIRASAGSGTVNGRRRHSRW